MQIQHEQTFSTRKLTFREALSWHDMVKTAAATFVATPQGQRDPVKMGIVEDLWATLVGFPRTAKTVVGDAVELTVPTLHSLEIQRVDGTAAGFAFVAILEQIAQVKLTDDFAVRAAVQKAWDAFEQRRIEANNVQEGFGCDKSASWHTLRDIANAPDDEELEAKLMEIVKLAGAMFDNFGYSKRKVPNDEPQEVVGATIGGQLERMLPSTLAKLADDDDALADMEAIKIIQRQAQQYEMKGESEKSRGPLVMAIDESGSMHDAHEGYRGRNTWAKATAICLTRIAWEEAREVRAIHFGTATVVQELPRYNYKAMFEMARSFLSGGTSFGASLTRSRAVVGDLDAEGYEGADVVIITDGNDYDTRYHDQAIDALDADGIELWTVAIGDDIPVDAPVRRRAKRYVHATDEQLANVKTGAHIGAGLGAAAMGNNSRDMN